MLGHLAPVDDLADPDSDLVGVDEPAGGDRGDDLAEVGVGGGEQGGAFAGAFVGQRRVAAGHQPLAGVVGMADLGEVGLVEQADSWSGPSAAASAATSGARSAVTQPNPPSSRRAAILRTGDHPAVADQDQVGQPELVADHVDGGGEGGRVGGVAGENPDRDRPAVGVGEQPVVDLWVAALAVPRVAEGGQRAARAGHIRRGQVEQRHPAGGQVPGGHRGLDGVLPAEQPVQRRYTSSVDASATPKSAARVVSAHQRVVASLLPGRTTRATSSAKARSRSRHGGPSSSGNPSRRAAA